jgi:hypothetical protein
MASSRPRYSRLGRELDRQGLLKEEANELEGLGIPVLNLGTIVPWKGVALALFLLGLGSLLLTVGLMIHLGDIKVRAPPSLVCCLLYAVAVSLEGPPPSPR